MNTNTSLAAAHTNVTNARYLLDATNRRVTFADLASLPQLFTHAGAPVEMHCLHLDPEFDGYNPTPVIRAKVRADDTTLTPVIGIRTERRREPYRAETRFCRFDPSGDCVELEGVARMPWEDPHMVVLPDGRVVAYGVHVEWSEDDPNRVSGFRTEFYIGESLEQLVYLGSSPHGHKDSRIIVKKDGSLGLYTRPQVATHEGKIAYTPLDGIYELASNVTDVYERAQYVGMGVFGDGTWGGPNHPVDLGNGWHMVKCHAATLLMDDQGNAGPNMIYSGFMLFHHPITGRVLVARPHANADAFPRPEQYKWEKVQKVVFPGGLYDLEIRDSGTFAATAVYGLRDASMVSQQVECLVPVEQLLTV